MELESDSLAPGGKTGDTVEEVMEVEEAAPESEISEVVPLPDDSAPAEPSEPAAERVCPNCGVAAAPDAAVCAECGANLMPEKAPAKKKLRIPKALQPLQEAWQKLREHKAFPLIAAIAAVVVILIVTVVIVHVRELEEARARRGRADRADAEAASGAAARQRRKSPSRRPSVQFRWPGFSDPAAVARDRILKIGQELAAYMDKNHQPPATLAEAGVAEADSADYDLRRRGDRRASPLPRDAYEAKPSASGEPYVLFSDGSARPVPAAQIPSVLLKKTESGWLTAADAALLAKTAPGDPRDQRPLRLAGSGPRRQARRRRSARRRVRDPGRRRPHQIAFTAGGQKEALQVDLKPGLVYTFVHPRQADLAWIPMRQYRAALTAQSRRRRDAATPPGRPAQRRPRPRRRRRSSSTFTVDRKEGFAVKSLKSPTESVDFLDGDGRTALASDLRSLAARDHPRKGERDDRRPRPGQADPRQRDRPPRGRHCPVQGRHHRDVPQDGARRAPLRRAAEYGPGGGFAARGGSTRRKRASHRHRIAATAARAATRPSRP